MLCAACLCMFQNGTVEGDHHRGSLSLNPAAENGCKICRALSAGYHDTRDIAPPIEYKFEWSNKWRPHWEISFYEDGFMLLTKIYVHVHLVADSPPGYQEFVDSVKEDLKTDTTRVRRYLPSSRYIPENTGHAAVAEMARKWLQECKGSHISCQQVYGTREQDWYPRRLIHVGTSEQSPHLIISENDTPRSGYATLSHCWGKEKFTVLTSDNIDDFCQNIQYDELPKTFREVITTCRRLGIIYIWIDSLCILQSGEGSKDDWQFHAREMGRIYMNCELNISVDVAANPEEGAFRSRNPDLLQDCYVWTPFLKPLSQANFGQDIELEPSPSDSYLASTAARNEDSTHAPFNTTLCAIFTEEDFSVSGKDLPLSTRAWVLQEKLLSPRTLHFLSDRIAWECEDRQAVSEYLVDSVASADRWGFDCLYQTRFNITESQLNIQGFFKQITTYTRRELSYPTEDKLIAFSSIAERYASGLGDEYCAGIFRSTLPLSLLWDKSDPRGRAEIYRAPSWSWASIDGRVNNQVLDTDKATVLARVNDVHIDLVKPTNPYGQVRSASLTLTGPLISMQEFKSGQQVHIQTYQDKNEEIWPDNDTYIIAIAMAHTMNLNNREYPNCWGLVLQKLSNTEYRRLGIWYTNDNNIVEKFPQETITII